VTGGLSHDNKPTNIIYGFLRTVMALQELFHTKHIVFCWDSKSSKRKELFPEYKKKRSQKYKEWTDKELRRENAFRVQMKKLRKVYLRQIGYRNIFCQKGHEADDLMASVSYHLPKDDEAIIITSDQDLLQCIRYNVSFYDPRKNKVITLQKFSKQYGITPNQWVIVKMYAGCSTDEVPGIRGIGEKRAIQFLRDELKETSKVFQKIEEGRTSIIKQNYPLVCLPFKGTKVFKLKKDKLCQKGWQEVVEKLGMKSFRKEMPMMIKGRRVKRSLL
jgi:5'-3' exonuclease